MFDVYPNPQNAPINIGAGVTVTTALSRELRSGEPKMYIRVAAVSIAAVPKLQLTAGTGDPVTLTTLTQPIFNQPASAGDYVADAKYTAEANNVYLIEVFLYLGTPSTWKLGITNTAGAAADFTFVVADSNPDASQPWMDAALTLSWDVLISETGPMALTIFNKGTGPLTGVTGAMSGTDAANFTFTPPVGAINPSGNQAASVNLLAFASTKNATASLTLSSNDTTLKTTAGHNGTVALSAKVEELELAFLLDGSGSMAYGPDGETNLIGVADSSTRWGKLKSAAVATLTVLKNFATGKGTFAVVVYPDITGFPSLPETSLGGGVSFPAPSPSASILSGMTLIGSASVGAATTQIDAHFPRLNGGATPMGAGIATTIGISGSTPWGVFGPEPASHRRWVILMTDGNHNSGPPDPPDFYDGKPAGFLAKSINVTTLGYGNASAALEPVNTTLLNTIASQGGGDASRNHFAQADATNDITTNFIKALLFSGLTLDTISDPSGILTASNPSVTRLITVTEFDRKVSFIVDWSTFDAQRLQVTVTTPLGEVISQSTGGGVVIDSNPRFYMITVDDIFIRNGRNPSSPRFGTWRLTITLAPAVVIELRAAAAAIDQELYDYQVIIDSRLRLTATLNQKTFAAGDPINISAHLLLDGLGLPDASVKLTCASPGTSALNWLADSPVTAAEYQAAAANQQSNPDNDSLGIKKLALSNKGQTFSPFANSNSLTMVDANGTGVYVASTLNTEVPGTYDFLIVATGALADGTPFRRERAVTIEVVVKPDAQSTLFQVGYVQVGTQTTATLTVKPQDRFGNAVLIDPRFDPSVLFSSHGGTFQGAMVDNHDGSYTRTLTYPSAQPPVVGITVGGNPVVQPTPLVPLGEFKWVDKVFQFKLGSEAPGANHHRNPQACLGDFLAKPTPPEFVSLGGHGAIVVGIARHLIVARGFDDDITVFISPDQPPRPYKVYAVCGHEHDHDWVEIGASNGGTQSFGLRAAHVRHARAIVIHDASGRIRNVDGTPSATPGVSVVAVGVRSVDVSDDDDWDDCILDWIRRFGHELFRWIP